jgi:multidrug efflux pump subunit AcrA (membrane-fusion protein)
MKLFVAKGAIVKKDEPLAIIDRLNNTGAITLTAPKDSKVSFAGMIQLGDFIKADQVAFVTHPKNERFFGIIEVPAGAIDQVKEGQNVLITLLELNADRHRSLNGKISYKADEPTKVFFL